MNQQSHSWAPTDHLHMSIWRNQILHIKQVFSDWHPFQLTGSEHSWGLASTPTPDQISICVWLDCSRMLCARGPASRKGGGPSESSHQQLSLCGIPLALQRPQLP